MCLAAPQPSVQQHPRDIGWLQPIFLLRCNIVVLLRTNSHTQPLLAHVRRAGNGNLQEDCYPWLSQEDVITLSAVLSAFQKADQWESAFTQLGMMLLGQVQPNTFSLNSVISSCDGSWQQPLSMLATPRFQELNDEISYNSVMMSICEEVLQWTKALELLRCMKQGGLRPDEASFCAANLRDLVTCVVDMYKPRTELMMCEL